VTLENTRTAAPAGVEEAVREEPSWKVPVGWGVSHQGEHVQRTSEPSRTPYNSLNGVRELAETGDWMQAARVPVEDVGDQAGSDCRAERRPVAVRAQKSIPRRARMPWSKAWRTLTISGDCVGDLDELDRGVAAG
jgi:hypothetical protein